MMSDKNDSEGRVSRSIAACNSCRVKKQKCNGQRPTCSRCNLTSQDCIFPKQQKRGPAKGYTEAIESRLHETEDILHKIIAHISPEELFSALNSSQLQSYPSVPLQPRTSAPDRKEFIAQWAAFPLNTTTEVQRWFETREKAACEAEEKCRYSNSTSNVRKDSGASETSTMGQASTANETPIGIMDHTEDDWGDESNTVPMIEHRPSTLEPQGNPQEGLVQPLESSDISQRPVKRPRLGGPVEDRGVSRLGLSAEFQDNFLW